jgi:hypothetical protein
VTAQGSESVAIGASAGNDDQGSFATAVGYAAGKTNQGNYTVAVGYLAGCNAQGQNAVAIGFNAGRSDQGSGAVAIGASAGNDDQGIYSVAIGNLAGNDDQAGYAVAIGNSAGRDNQGGYAVAIGNLAGDLNQHASSIVINATGVAVNSDGSSRMYVAPIRGPVNNGNYNLAYNTTDEEITYRAAAVSDDRLKENETYITSAIKSLFKIRPQEYDIKPQLESEFDDIWKRQSGVIAQEIYYQVPELRHLVTISPQAGDVDSINPIISEDPTQDPDYSIWGPEPASVDYIQFIPYLIKAIQEVVTELPRSKTTVSNTWGQHIIGLVVSASGNAHKTNTTPIVTLSNVYMDKKWYGVVSEQVVDTNDYDTLIDTKGDTRIWVTNINGPLESGDLLTTSNVASGYTQKQNDDNVHNYTVAKVTQDCDFTTPIERPIRRPLKELSSVTYYTKTIKKIIRLAIYEKLNEANKTYEEIDIYYKISDVGENFYYDTNGTEISLEKYHNLPDDERTIVKKEVITPEKYQELSEDKREEFLQGTQNIYKSVFQSKSTKPLYGHDEIVIIEELVDVLDENGQVVWENTNETEPSYTLVDHGTYKAALITCKLI